MELNKSEVIGLFETLGFGRASTWSATRLKKKIEDLPELIGEDVSVVEDEEAQELLTSIFEAIENEEQFVILDDEPEDVDEEDVEEEDVEEEEVVDEDEEADEDDEEEDEEPVTTKKRPAKKRPAAGAAKKKRPAKKKPAAATTKKKTTKKKGPTKTTTPGGQGVKKKTTKKKTTKKGAGSPVKRAGKVGVIASIVEFLSAANSKKPLSREALLKKLANRFKDREEDGMMVTIKSQLNGGRLAREKGLDVKKNDKGFWIVS